MTTAQLAVRVKPGSSRTRVGGSHAGRLVVAVGARAVDGAATTAALEALASALGVRRHQVTLVVGATSRDKVFRIVGAPVDWQERVEALRGGRAEPS